MRSELLDCVQANLAVLADRFHGRDTYLRLGAVLRFAPDSRGLPTVEPSVDLHLADAERLAGLSIAGRWSNVDEHNLVRLAREHGRLYVLADAFDLPWVPYYRHRHLEHSFLLEVHGNTATVTDAYHNETQWGRALPDSWEYRLAKLILPNRAEVIRFARGELAEIQPEVEFTSTVESYVDAYREPLHRSAVLEHLTMQTWLLARSRKLHAAYRRLDVADHLVRWDRIVEQTYLAARRVARGRAEPPGLLDAIGAMLTADREIFHIRTPSTSDIAGEVARVVAEVLQLGEPPAPDAELTQFSTFSSFRIVEIVDRLEQQFHIEFAADDLVPELLHRVCDLCDLVLRAKALDTGRIA
jgi:acyl carrier protein